MAFLVGNDFQQIGAGHTVLKWLNALFALTALFSSYGNLDCRKPGQAGVLSKACQLRIPSSLQCS